jgi:hypothetical protein
VDTNLSGATGLNSVLLAMRNSRQADAELELWNGTHELEGVEKRLMPASTTFGEKLVHDLVFADR